MNTGLYIIDEVGDEAHASEWISSLTEYEEMYRERCRRDGVTGQKPSLRLVCKETKAVKVSTLPTPLKEIAGPHPLLDV